MADLSSLSFAGSEVGEQELAASYSAEILVGHFYEDSRFVA